MKGYRDMRIASCKMQERRGIGGCVYVWVGEVGCPGCPAPKIALWIMELVGTTSVVHRLSRLSRPTWAPARVGRERRGPPKLLALRGRSGATHRHHMCTLQAVKYDCVSLG